MRKPVLAVAAAASLLTLGVTPAFADTTNTSQSASVTVTPNTTVTLTGVGTNCDSLAIESNGTLNRGGEVSMKATDTDCTTFRLNYTSDTEGTTKVTATASDADTGITVKVEPGTLTATSGAATKGDVAALTAGSTTGDLITGIAGGSATRSYGTLTLTYKAAAGDNATLTTAQASSIAYTIGAEG